MILLRNATLIDGTGAPPFPGDLRTRLRRRRGRFDPALIAARATCDDPKLAPVGISALFHNGHRMTPTYAN